LYSPAGKSVDAAGQCAYSAPRPRLPKRSTAAAARTRRHRLDPPAGYWPAIDRKKQLIIKAFGEISN
jgi:hypothetical protein